MGSFKLWYLRVYVLEICFIERCLYVFGMRVEVDKRIIVFKEVLIDLIEVLGKGFL